MKRRALLLTLLCVACLGAGQKPKTTQTVMIQIIFSEETEFGVFRDALYLSPDVYTKTTQANLDALKRKRIDAWVDRIKNPPAPVEPTKEQLQAELVEIEKQKESLEVRKTELLSAIAAKDKK
jgi:hypothetical protein